MDKKKPIDLTDPKYKLKTDGTNACGGAIGCLDTLAERLRCRLEKHTPPSTTFLDLRGHAEETRTLEESGTRQNLLQEVKDWTQKYCVRTNYEFNGGNFIDWGLRQSTFTVDTVTHNDLTTQIADMLGKVVDKIKMVINMEDMTKVLEVAWVFRIAVEDQIVTVATQHGMNSAKRKFAQMKTNAGPVEDGPAQAGDNGETQQAKRPTVRDVKDEPEQPANKKRHIGKPVIKKKMVIGLDKVVGDAFRRRPKGDMLPSAPAMQSNQQQAGDKHKSKLERPNDVMFPDAHDDDETIESEDQDNEKISDELQHWYTKQMRADDLGIKLTTDTAERKLEKKCKNQSRDRD